MTDEEVTTEELKQDLDEVLARAREGHPLTITRDGVPVAQLRLLTPEEVAIERIIAKGVITREALAQLPAADEALIGEPTPLPEGSRTTTEILDELRQEREYS